MYVVANANKMSVAFGESNVFSFPTFN